MKHVTGDPPPPLPRHCCAHLRIGQPQSLLANTERIVQEIDSVEYGLTDIQEYYANTGALKKAAESTQAKNADPAQGPRRRVGVSVVEAYGKDVEPRELEATLRIEYRSKLLNPKWAEAMSQQASFFRRESVCLSGFSVFGHIVSYTNPRGGIFHAVFSIAGGCLNGTAAWSTVQQFVGCALL